MTHAALSNCSPHSPQASSLNCPTPVQFCHELHFYFSAISQIEELHPGFLFFCKLILQPAARATRIEPRPLNLFQSRMENEKWRMENAKCQAWGWRGLTIGKAPVNGRCGWHSRTTNGKKVGQEITEITETDDGTLRESARRGLDDNQLA